MIWFMRWGLLAVVAAVVAAWFGLGLRQATELDRASAIATSSARLTPAQVRAADGALSASAFLNPGRQVDLLRSQVALAGGDRLRAARLAAGVARTEPLNAQAWVALGRAATTPAQGVAAFRHLGALVRSVPARR